VNGRSEWAKADLLAAMSSHSPDALKAAQRAKAEAVREWEAAKHGLEVHLNTHNLKEE
jgi:hypothetical protein